MQAADLLWTADGNGNIGNPGPGSNRPNHVYVKTDVIIGDSTTTITSDAITTSGALTVLTGAATNLTMNPGAGGLTNLATVSNTGAVNIGTNGARVITIGSTTNGHTTALNLNSAGTLTATSKDTTTYQLTADDAADKVLTVSAANAGAGGGDIAITAGGSIDLTTDTELDMTIGGASSWTIKANDGSSVVIDDGATTYLTFDTNTNLPQVEMGEFLELGASEGAGEQMDEKSGQSLAAGDIVIARDNAGTTELEKSNASTGGGTLQNVSGVVVDASSGTCQVNTVHGARVAIKCVTAVGGTCQTSDNGSIVFLDTMAGRASLGAPSSTGEAVVAVGVLVGATGASATPEVIWNPQFRYQNA
jgi:hypothetical protein